MARSILFALGVAWSLAGAAGLLLAALGTEWLEQMLPPLAINTDALRAAIVTVALGVIGLGVTHWLVLGGLRAGMRLAWTVGILFCALLTATTLALAAASATSAAADPSRLLPFLAGAGGAALLSVAYGLATARLVEELRAGSAY